MSAKPHHQLELQAHLFFGAILSKPFFIMTRKDVSAVHVHMHRTRISARNFLTEEGITSSLSSFTVMS